MTAHFSKHKMTRSWRDGYVVYRGVQRENCIGWPAVTDHYDRDTLHPSVPPTPSHSTPPTSSVPSCAISQIARASFANAVSNASIWHSITANVLGFCGLPQTELHVKTADEEKDVSLGLEIERKHQKFEALNWKCLKYLWQNYITLQYNHAFIQSDLLYKDTFKLRDRARNREEFWVLNLYVKYRNQLNHSCNLSYISISSKRVAPELYTNHLIPRLKIKHLHN